MPNSSEPGTIAVARAFMAALSGGEMPADLVAENAGFMALNVRLEGREALAARLTGAESGAVYRAAAWQVPEPDGTAVRVRGTLPAGWRWSAIVLLLHFDTGRISLIQQQGVPAPSLAAGGLALTPALKDLVDNALARRHPMLLAHIGEDGRPVLSFRGSTQAISDDQLAIWLRNPEGGLARAIKVHPQVALVYRDEDSKATYQFQGRARLVDDPALRAQVYVHAPQAEQHHDFARIGAVIVIDLDRVQGYAGLGPGGQVDPIHMVRTGAD